MRPVIGLWKPPTTEELENRVYARGKPDFHPFPTITDVRAAVVCPRAAFHLLLHGRQPFQGRYRGGASSASEDYHRFIARLKLEIIAGIWMTGTAGLQSKVYASTEQPKYVWPFVKEWANNHFHQAKKGDDVFFETTVAGAPRFNVGGRRMPFYIRGRIDEVDLTRKRIVERTTRKKDDALCVRKDFQLWLGWKILCSITKEGLPKEWRGCDFEKFKLVLETPAADVPVTPSQQYEDEALAALTWIRDIAYDPQVWLSVWQASNQICAPRSVRPGCELRGTCFSKPPKYPEARKEMKKALGSKYQPLLWETLWRHDLDQYRLILVDRKQLEKMKKISSAQVIGQPSYHTWPGGAQSVQLEVRLANAGDVKATNRVQTILFGTPLAGLRAEATVVEKKGDVLKLDLGDLPLTTLPRHVLITSIAPDLMLFEEAPTFLTKRVQSDAFTFSRRGTSDQQKAQQSCNVQLVEGIFGGPAKRLRRGRK